MLLATVCGLLLVQRGLDRTFGWALAALLGAAIVWMLVSVLWPARPDRTCASCGRTSLRRSDPRSTKGVSCGECGYEDASASSFLLAEEDAGSIEPIVLAERSGTVGRSGGNGRAS
jgi:hypothetical protein